MTYFYDSHLLVRPFITAPLAERQQAFILSHSDHTTNSEIFMESAHEYQNREHPSLPIVCEVRRFGMFLLASTTIETSAVERVTGRVGTSLCFGVVVDPRAIGIPNLFTRTYELFCEFFSATFCEELSSEGAGRMLTAIQAEPVRPIPLRSLEAIVQVFEQRFGISPRATGLVHFVGHAFRLYRSNVRIGGIASFAHYLDVLPHWRYLDARISGTISPEVDVVRPMWLDIASVCAAPITVAGCFVAHAFTNRLQDSTRSGFLLDIAFSLLAAVALGILETKYRASRDTGMVTPSRTGAIFVQVTFLVLTISLASLGVFLGLIASETLLR
jgi:hypothetical protein